MLLWGKVVESMSMASMNNHNDLSLGGALGNLQEQRKGIGRLTFKKP